MTSKISNIERIELSNLWEMKIAMQSLNDSILTYDEAKISRSVVTDILQASVECFGMYNGSYDNDIRSTEVIRASIYSVAMFISEHFDTCMSSIIYAIYRY